MERRCFLPSVTILILQNFQRVPALMIPVDIQTDFPHELPVLFPRTRSQSNTLHLYGGNNGELHACRGKLDGKNIAFEPCIEIIIQTHFPPYALPCFLPSRSLPKALTL